MADGDPEGRPLDIDAILPDADAPLRDLENFNPDVELGWPTVIATLFAVYFAWGEEGVEWLIGVLRERAAQARDGKFDKRDAAYLPFGIIPPVGWEYKCRTCAFYQPNPEGECAATCEIVGHPYDPFGGECISPEGWCGLWVPPPETEALAWLREALNPTDANRRPNQPGD